ncbi:MAG: glycoside hydrolase family 15 protein [Planctomycetota bacterium]|nr:glycoside hydrolase family 15 protein [Planctomycetota bacterium]
MKNPSEVCRRVMPVVRTMAGVLLCTAGWAAAQPSLFDHNPSGQVFNQPGGITGREPEVVRENESVDLWFKIGPSFTYDRVWIYYTLDGTEPQGSNGTAGNASTQVMASFNRPGRGQEIFFQYNQPRAGGGNDDWWKATMPAETRPYARFIKYKISAQRTTGNTTEVFANGGLTFSYLNKLAWPGAGAGSPNPAIGYPGVNFWKEEAFIGNTFTAAMLDQNGSWWDMYFPTPGGVQGVGTRNEGYANGGDTFPPLLSVEKRGQMHLNQATVGIRPVSTGVTHWISNTGGSSYSNIQQSYLNDDTNTVRTSQTLTANGNNISVTQYDFAPAGIDFPDGLNGTGEQKHILVKRMVLRNNLAQAQDVNVYLYLDPALNGGDTYDFMFWDPARGSMTAYDKTRRTVTGTGAFINPPEEYNITTFSGYEKNIALYLTSAMYVAPGAGHSNGGPATDTWRDTSGDQSQGWIGKRLTLPPGVDVEVSFVLAGAHFRPDPITDNIPGNDGVYDNELAPVLDWFYQTPASGTQAATDAYWTNWLASGTTIDTPDADYDRLMKRGLLATALHQDGVNGGVVAGYHNGAYYYVWPRDAMWAAVTLARAGHLPEARKAIDWMRNTTFRDVEPFFGSNPINGQQHRGFWKQKYTTDGFTVWGAPQIDGTAVFPWAVMWYYDMTADYGYLFTNYASIWDAVAAMTRDSIDNRLRYEESVNLVYTNNLWEDQYDVFIYSNANIVRGLRDSARAANILGRPADVSNFTNLANTVKSGLDGRLDWNGENTDASQLGIVYPFETHSPIDPKAVKVIDRINGVANDRFGNNRPLVNFANFFNNGMGWTDLINRYWGDGYWGNGSSASPWGAGPWFLTTMWYGMYYAYRADYTPGTGDIDNHKYRLDLLLDQIGPVGLGAEQIAPRGIPGQPSPRDVGSLMYPGQNDFTLQTAWPNAWESMSFFVDSLMGFLDYTPDAANATMTVKPKLPSSWNTMTFKNVELYQSQVGQQHSVDITIDRESTLPGIEGSETHTFKNTNGFNLTLRTTLRIPTSSAGRLAPCRVLVNGVQTFDYTYDPSIGAVEMAGVQATPVANALTTIKVEYALTADFDSSGFVDSDDFVLFVSHFELGCTGSANPDAACTRSADFDGSGFVDSDDFIAYVSSFERGCN